ncbi:MAG: S-adenosylmethionine:tRNA ribosyltransferase-isomerase [Bacteroidota bacterium]
MNNIVSKNKIDFKLPEHLKCARPTELRKIRRDEVLLMVSDKNKGKINHDYFKNIGAYLKEGDVLVVNTSGTLPAALDIFLPNKKAGRMHLSTQLDKNKWVVEIRVVKGNKTQRFNKIKIGQEFNLPDGGKVKIIRPFYKNNFLENHLYLWEAEFDLKQNIKGFLMKYGKPIRYDQINSNYPLSFYQTIFSDEMGSAEMPSAGRAFTTEVVMDLMIKGVQFAPVVLHTGVSSLERDEKPYPEFFRVPATTASLLNLAKKENRRIVAVGTTAVRAVESAVNEEGRVVSRQGWTDLYITPERGMRVVEGLLTGFHEPEASHLLMLGAVADQRHLQKCYDEAISQGYHWHEFGDLHLIV